MSTMIAATACIKNKTGTVITRARLSHSYDYDHAESIFCDRIYNESVSPAMTWYFHGGAIPTGHNYWRISFDAEGKRWYTRLSCELTSIIESRRYEGFDTSRNQKEKGRLFTWEISKRGDCMYATAQFEEVKIDHPLSSCDAARPDARPVYVIAHRCNDLFSPDMAMHAGANGVEFDIQYRGGKYVLLHDGGFVGGVEKFLGQTTDFAEWLERARKAADMFGEQFAVMLFDLKVAGDSDKKAAAQHVKNIRAMARKAINEGQHRVHFLFSVSPMNNIAALDEVIGDLYPDEGVSIDEGVPPADVQKFFQERQIANGWYGDGIFVGGPSSDERMKRLSEAVTLRNNGGSHAIKKVCFWTLAEYRTIRSAFNEMGLDAILVNVPHTMTHSVTMQTAYGMMEAEQVLAESNGSLRLATTHDNPFKA